MTLYLLKVHLQTFLCIPISNKCQILSCDTILANELYVNNYLFLIAQLHVSVFYIILRESRILYAKVTKLMQWKQLYKLLLRTDSRLKAAEHRNI